MKYKAVLFDMDGTVLDTLGDLAAAVNHTLREFSMPERSIAEVAAALGNGAAYLIAHTVPDGTPKELTDKVLAACGKSRADLPAEGQVASATMRREAEDVRP